MSQSDTRTRILDVAQELVQRLGVNAMSYQHISNAVGIRKASIHHHFPTKEDLITALLNRYNANFLGLVDDIVTAPIDGKAKLLRYVGLFEATLSDSSGEKACLCGMIGAELATLGCPSVELVRRFYQENEQRLTQILVQGREESIFRFKGDAGQVAKMTFALLEGGVLIARSRDCNAYFADVRDGLLKLLLDEI
jgi:TetR/AcrR family transcriptional repressor of nem operon